MGLFSKLFGSQPAGRGHTSGKRVLVVDDSITIQKVIELTLPEHELHSAKSVAEATSALARETKNAGADAVLNKPFKSQALANEVERLLPLKH